MARVKRQCPGGVAYHAMNRGVMEATLFEDEADYAAFEREYMLVTPFILLPPHHRKRSKG